MMLVPDETTNTARLRMDEAVLLCHAMTGHVAEQIGLRVIFIKGPVTVAQGLREPRQSVDVDVFVEPGEVSKLVSAMKRRGWEVRPAEPDLDAFPRHSETLFHRSWPVDVDVHYRYPGMEGSADQCFEAMWRASDTHELAGKVIRVPTRALAVCLLALHSLRTPWLASSRTDLDFLLALPLEADRQEIMAIARDTESISALRPFIEEAFGAQAVESTPPPSPEWSVRTKTRSPGTARAIALANAPWHRKPRLLANAVFPSKTTLLANDIYADLSFRGRLKQNVKRWQTLFISLPEFVVDVKEYLASRRVMRR